MKILFWNLKKNANEKWVEGIIRENDVDIALFAEYQSTLFDQALMALQDYGQYDGYGGCDKITLICKQTVKAIVKREQSRYTLYVCTINGISYNIAGVHLPSPPNSDANDRKSVIRDIVQDLSEQERITKNRASVVIGDLNCNPFSEELIQKDSFNAVLFKSLINEQEIIRYNERKRRRFYNPIINYLSEDTKMYGSLYYSSGSAPLYWNCFDQVLVRKELIEGIKSVQYIKTICGKSLMSKVKPNGVISDHLPLLVNIEKGID